MAECFGKSNIGTEYTTPTYAVPPKPAEGCEWVVVQDNDKWTDWVLKEKRTDSSNQAPYWLRRQEEQKTVTGASDKDTKYAEWFEKEYTAVTREYPPYANTPEHKLLNNQTLELNRRRREDISILSREVAELRRSNKFLWVIVLFNAVMGIVFGSRDLFGW